MLDDLSDSLGEFIVIKFLNPCKKCLVRAVCKPAWTSCDDHTRYLNLMDTAGDAIKGCLIVLLLITEVIVITIAIGPELYEWIKIIF